MWQIWQGNIISGKHPQLQKVEFKKLQNNNNKNREGRGGVWGMGMLRLLSG